MKEIKFFVRSSSGYDNALIMKMEGHESIISFGNSEADCFYKLAMILDKVNGEIDELRKLKNV